MSIHTNRMDPQITHQARRMVMEQGVLPAGMLRGDIEASWNRCLEFGLRLDQKPDRQPEVGSQIETLLERNQRLITSTIPEMEALYRHFGQRDSVVILSDDQATVLKSLGGELFQDKAARISLLPGASWREREGGTNAIGTVLKNNKPMMIQGSEHYFDAIGSFCCSAAPIFAPCGSVAGVLDVTSDQGFGSFHSLGLVSMSARLIENRLFTDLYRSQILIAVHSRPEFVDSLWQGLLAFTSEGYLLAMDREAGKCLDLDPAEVGRRDFSDLFGITLGEVVDQSKRSPRSPLVLRKGGAAQLYGRLLHVPGTSSVVVPVDPRTPAKKQPLPASGADASDITLSDVVFEDKGFARAAMQGTKALNHQIPLLLLGETGSGKEVLARALHDQGIRSKSNFVALNCAAIPEGLIESELFGYQDGAFTGARKGGMQGKVQQAHGGTLFLDEIGDMPLDLQARLLRVLQERSVTPLGGSKEIPVDISVICATHRDIKQMVADGSFREDLYYRLNGVVIQIPALRNRVNLVGFVPHLLNQMLGGNHGIRVDSSLMTQFQNYSWPGNVRQLQTVIKTCLAFMDDDESLITEQHLTDDFRQSLVDSLQTARRSLNDDPISVADGSLKTLKTSQTEQIKQAIEACSGNMSAAAVSLGISRATLYRRLQHAGIKVVSDIQLLDS